MSQYEHEYFRVRQEKAEALRSKGLDPYPARFNRTHTSLQALAFFEEREESHADDLIEISVGGRVMARRGMGKATFLDISDEIGRAHV